MKSRSQFGPRERAARSRLAQLLHGHEFIQGSTVLMARTCGKAGCRCGQGDKHESLYLSVKIEGKRRMVYIPGDLEEEVCQRVEAYREMERLTAAVSGACLDRMLEQKRKRKDNG
jgi:hypothetical protein